MYREQYSTLSNIMHHKYEILVAFCPFDARTDEFRWNLDLIQHVEPVINNNLI
jgi:hypothetical protein